ncbi:MAG: MoaD/ThiS family protein [Methylomonas sp.]|nr:MoaD/ThiS family protein [Methylomonas sp.]PPD19606.1 MAG: molybdopterin synthase sulfur carrier subunit [Methylomonas sp.]PPD25702.1 MAG: molybdopterin synthase sulfur carrier subunit [Methylomonas sp.]PPD36913.1 MAG: molybdopterin synthase sulfur carrier subunit [Methylomonas sp.]PPD38709.1 MAG: molybdopterin synthase sulfur carrier subunit [Methylomonas sp.]
MSIKVRYFASLKETVGKSEDDLPTDAPLSVRAVWQRLNPELNPQGTTLAAVNKAYVDNWDAQVCDGDELAFFPPVTGG